MLRCWRERGARQSAKCQDERRSERPKSKCGVMFVKSTIHITFVSIICFRRSASFLHLRHSPRVQELIGRMADINKSMSSDYTTNASAKMSPMIDLQLHTLRKSPTEFLSSLATDCERLGIENFDLYGDFHSDAQKSYLRQFESEVAGHFGKEDGVFCLSGGIAQSIVLSINAKKNQSVSSKTGAFACHPTSHLLLHENNHFDVLLDMQAVVLNPTPIESVYDPDRLKDVGCYGLAPIRLSHVQDMFASLDGTQTSPTSCTVTYPKSDIPINSLDVSIFILELPHREIGGKLTPWNEVKEISVLCKARNIIFHCDGARIFEASAGYG